MNPQLFSPCNGHVLVEYIPTTPSTNGLIMPTPYHRVIIRAIDSWDERQCPKDFVDEDVLLGMNALIQANNSSILPGIAIKMEDGQTYHLIKFELILAVYETEGDK